MTVRFHLRDSTRAAHERTDSAFSALDLAKRDDYRVFLASHLMAYRSLEPVFARDMSVELRPPAMASYLAKDLDTLGYGAPDAAVPTFSGDALGAAYVVAGSHFGKRVLSRRQGRSDDPLVREAGRYLASPELRAYWPILQDALEAASDTPDRLADGASAAFTLFADCLAIVNREGARREFA